MKLISSAFDHNEKIPSKYTCDGENISPPLTISDVPKNLRKDGMWNHWVVFNMPPDMDGIKEGNEPQGMGGVGTNGKQGYFGPCPPDREHRYFFKLFALDQKLDLTEQATKEDLENAMKGHILEQAELIGRYERT